MKSKKWHYQIARKRRGENDIDTFWLQDENLNQIALVGYCGSLKNEEIVRRIVQCANAHDELLQIAEMVNDMPAKNDSLFDAHCMNLRAKAKQTLANASKTGA